MSWEMIRDNWPILWALLMTAINLLQLILAKTYVKREEFDSLRSRMSSVENQVHQLPDRDEFHRLQLDISNLRGEIRELGPSIRQVSRISNLLLENELKEKN
ncbi:DUF2730 family protein [Escherichia coli]|uniref:DUF2730 family protein n=1 Tax=Escherichia coli TaxID=562 RepID=UPI0010F00BDF|nr:DUF2730 family protein [Escherichia coli]GDO93283.1 hypothetical protein BvCmsNSNP012_00061 [Escherichia coli]